MLYILKPLLRRPLTPALVVLQVALACAIGCNLLFLLRQQMAPLLASDGIADPAHVVLLYHITPRGVPWNAAALSGLEDQLRMIDGVSSVSYAAMPLLGSMQVAADVYGSDRRRTANPTIYIGDHLRGTLGLKLVAGRHFTAAEQATTLGTDMGFAVPGPVILTRSLADRLFPGGQALGRMIHYVGAPGGRIVVGIVDHLVRNASGNDYGNLGYAMLFPGVPQRWPSPQFVARVDTPDTGRTCRALVEAVKADFGPDLLAQDAPQCTTYAQLHDAAMAAPRAAVMLFGGMALVVLVVALSGIVGMTGNWVRQRRRWIGVKRALGARRADIVRELLGENLIVIGSGVLLGAVGACALNLWLMWAYAFSRLPLTYLPAGALLLLVLGQLAALLPALRAARIPPVAAMRGS